MPTNQTLLWTALPNNVYTDGSTEYLKLSVFMNPRLRTNEGSTLSLFPDFLNWAAHMQSDQVTFSIEVNDGTGVYQVPAEIVSKPPDQNLWKLLFNENIPVRSYEFAEDNLYNRPIVSFPLKQVLNYLKERYQNIASQAPFDLPHIKYTEEGQFFLEEEFKELIDLTLSIEGEEQLTNRINLSLENARIEAREREFSTLDPDSEPVIPKDLWVNGNGAMHNAFYQTMLFHYRAANAEPEELPNDLEEARAHYENEVDFHQMLTALGDFPGLLRRLGIVIDLKIDTAAIPKTTDDSDLGKMKLRVIPNWPSNFPTRGPESQGKWTANYCPWTVYFYKNINGKSFFKAFSHQEESCGIWSPDTNVELVQVDVDGAALKTINFAGNMARTNKNEEDQTIDAPKQIGVPALRTGGISVIRSGNARNFNKIFYKSAEFNRMLEGGDSPQLLDLYAEDLTRGYRLDVFDELTGEWRSLHQRVGTYKLVKAPEHVPEIIDIDEGFIQPSVTSTVGPHVPTKEIYIHDALFTWDGWSLSAPRLGKSISRSPRAPSSDEPETLPQKVENIAMTHLGLETNFTVKDGTLPRLRFGQAYCMRVRTVDFAGNGPTLNEAKEIEEAGPDLQGNGHIPKNDVLIYRRFEPINPPELVPRQLYNPNGDTNNSETQGYTEGESLERMVIRSNFDKSIEEYAEEHPAYQPFNERHIAPPKASLHLIETHGLLDEALDAKKNGMSPDEVRARIKEVYDLAVREAGTLNDTSLPSVRFIPTGKDPTSTEGYAVHTEEELEIPYLPDPWAVGVVFQGLPGLNPDELFKITFDLAIWYQPKLFRIRLVEGNGRPEWDQISRVLTIQLPKSNIAHVRVSSCFGGELEWLGMWKWLVESVESGAIPNEKLHEIKQGIIEGRHWMFTPYRELTLVHAVQQPLEQPNADLRVERWENSTAAYLKGAIRIHAPSTSKLDILADWTEMRDDLDKDEPNLEPIKLNTHVMELPTILDGQEILVQGLNQDCNKEDSDVLRIIDNELLILNSEMAKQTIQCLKKELANPHIDLYLQRFLQDQINLASKVAAHEFGDTKYRRVTYRVQATSRFREYFVPTMEPNHLIQEGYGVELDILSSAKPNPPRVLFVLPTFNWKQETDANGTIKSVRRSGGVRVYLDRPWWSSGEGELLGVVLMEHSRIEVDDMNDYFTFWGQDPIWRSPMLQRPKPENFINSKKVFNTVKLTELKETFVKVVGFEVQWDKKRKLWYCDIEMDTADAYYPFIRLSLARFQPNSLVHYEDEINRIPLRDHRISTVVLADFVQTVPNRSVTVTREVGVSNIYTVSVSGITYTASTRMDQTVTPDISAVSVRVQRRVPEIEDETLGWSDLPIEKTLIPSIPDDHGVVIWQGEVSIAPYYQGEELRIVVQETERIFPATIDGHVENEDHRIVYIDTIPLSN
ncbi:TPA: hypothetical protein QC285_003695 [Bacillus cereus]|uniref:hypothetical protein n=1 Tax=Bacillus cereus TaxID=1396 RepID=UPI002967875C|nr:hypothetical protein [Bacillus cereus]